MKLKVCVAVNQTSVCFIVGHLKVTRLPTETHREAFQFSFPPVCCQEEERRFLVKEEWTYYSPQPGSAAPPSAQIQGESPEAPSLV